MNNNHQLPHSAGSSGQDEEIDLRKYLMLFLNYWYWFVFGVLFFTTTAFILNRITKKIYNVSATILIEDEKSNQSRTGTSVTGTADIISGFGLFPSMKNLQNQLIILQSSSQIESTVRSLNFEVSYFTKEVLGLREIINEAPFIVIPDKSKAQILGISFNVTLNSDSTLTIISAGSGGTIMNYNYLTGQGEPLAEFQNIEKTVRFGDAVEGEWYSFILMPRAGSFEKMTLKNNGFSFIFNSYENTIKAWENSLTLANIQKDASIVKLTIPTECPEKAVVFLNKHLEMYMQRTLDKKNLIANNTIDFIDNQLVVITESLDRTELALQNYRSSNKVVDLSYQGQQLYMQAEELGTRKEELRLSQRYFEYLEEYINSNRESGDLIAPSVMGIADPLLNSLVLSINTLTDHKVAMGGENSNNPNVATINRQISNAKSTIMENSRNMMNNNNIAIKDIETRLSEILKEVQKLPQTERELFRIERIFKLNDNLYTYLLQQRYSAQIAKASNTPDNEIIDQAKTVTPHIRPRSLVNYIIALLLGLILPGAVILILSALNNRITSEEDIKLITGLPFSGYIPHNNKDFAVAVLNEKGSHLSESFRGLRTRLKFFTKETSSPVILITSSMPGEGKSFTSINLASVCSLSGKKTVLVGFDLRRPTIGKEFALADDNGVSTYLIGRSKLSEILQESGSDNLWVIPSGPLPPNPSELIASEKTRGLFTELKERFDYIIVDSAPLGIVTDTFSLADIADLTLIVVRHNKTIKEALKSTINEATANGIKGMSILLNDIGRDQTYYGYAGKYGYGYGYGKKYVNG